jgi:hypothetical protein
VKYLFPVTAKLRKLWKAKPPAGYVNSNSDYVKYHAIPVEGKKPLSNPSHKTTACYSSCRPGYDKFDITCMPLQKGGVVDLVEAYEFMNFFTRYGIIPEGINIWGEKDGVHCHIPAAIGNPHNVYVALTCYRWIDSHPPLVWDFLNIMSQDGDKHPLQILPYIVGKHIGNSNHTFLPTSYDGMSSSLNPLVGLASKIYFDVEDKRGAAQYKNPMSYVNTSIGEVVKTITPNVKAKSGPGAWAGDITGPRFLLEKPEDACHPDLFEMYTIPNITEVQIEEFLSAHFTQEKK